MSAVIEAREPNARYLQAAQPVLVRQFDLLGKAPGGISRLRELILTLALQGKLAPQLPGDEPASVLLHRIERAKEQLVAAGAMKRPKVQPEIADDEQPFPIPAGWQWVRLGTLLQKIGAGSTPLGGKEVYVASGVKFLRSQNVWNDGLRLEGVAYISPATHARMAGTVVVANDLLFNITGASIGRCAAVPADFDEANVSQHVTIIRPVLPSLNAFLHTVLISRLVQQTVIDVQVGVSREGLSIAKLGNFLIPIPPIQEQARIVARVDELMRLCDALEAKGRLEAEQHARLLGTLLGTLTDSSTPEELAANWQRVADHFDLLLDRPEAVDALEQTILQLAVRGLLVPKDANDETASDLLARARAEKERLTRAGELKGQKPLAEIDDVPFDIPLGWAWARLEELGISFDYGSSQKSCDDTAAVPILRMGNVQAGRVVFSNLKFLKDQKEELPSLFLEEGDLLFNRTNSFELVGKTGLFEGFGRPVTFASYLIRIRPNKSLCDPRYLNIFMNTQDCRKTEIEPDLTQQTGQANYNGTKLRNIRVPLPPREEQTRIVARVTELRRLCADLRQRLTTGQTIQSRLAEALVAEVA